MRLTYQFGLHINGTPYDAFPVWKDSMKKIPERVNGQYFFRERLSEPLIFTGDDYDRINSAPFDAEFLLFIDQYVDGVQQPQYFKGVFYKQDGIDDEDSCTFTVTPEPDDIYKEFVEGMEKEFDLIKLNPDRAQVAYKKQPIFQVYIEGSDFLFNIIDGVYWTTQVPEPKFAIDLGNLEFTFADNFIFIPGMGELNPDVSGRYAFGGGAPYIREDNVYRIEFTGTGPSVEWKIARVSDGGIVYRGVTGEGPFGSPGHTQQGTIFTSETTSDQCRVYSASMWGRIITDESTVDGNSTNPIPNPDISSETYNYTRALGIDVGSNITLSDDHQTDSQRFGTFDSTALHFADQYFGQLILAPSSGIGSLYPVTRAEWKYFSIWFHFDSALRTIQDEGSTELMTVAYQLHDSFEKVMKQLNVNYNHSNTDTYSEFLYPTGNNPISSETQPELLITPKSNILVGDYDQPAQRALIKLSEMLKLYQYAYNLFPIIEAGSTRVRLEHLHWFENGGSYSSPVIGADLTTLKEAQTKKNWDHATGRFSFEKQNLPEQILTKWADQGSEPFDGYPIEIISKFVQKGNINERVIGRFSADIDFAQANTSKINSDGFFILGCLDVSGQLTVPFFEVELAYNIQWKMQNGYLSLIYLIDKFHRHGLPAPDIEINEIATTATSVRRSKIQAPFDIPFVDFSNLIELVTSKYGNAEILRIEETMATRSLKITLKYENN